VERADFVLVVAEDGSEILLVHQYRPATGRFYWALPAGFLRRDEGPEHGAQRELREETGWDGTGWRLLAELHPLPGYVKSRAFVVSCAVTKEHDRDLDDEEIGAIRRVSWEEAVRMILDGEIDEMQAVAAIMLAREALRRSHVG
jgi:ADP-ribose pyrophosphatase YjhB (NUDIX family)